MYLVTTNTERRITSMVGCPRPDTIPPAMYYVDEASFDHPSLIADFIADPTRYKINDQGMVEKLYHFDT